MIRVEGLQKRFGEKVAVQRATFDAQDGQVTGLLGPNGAGKTTTLRMLCGLLRPDGGKVLVDELDVALAPRQARARLGVLPDTRGLYPRLTVREHLRYYGRLQGLGGRALEQALLETANLLELGELLDRRTGGFSQGERAKTAIARALVHKPTNVLLDEPTNGLDVMSTRAMRAAIRALRDQGRCVLFSSHIMQEVAALCDRVVIIARGTVVAQGTVPELLARSGQANLEDAFVHLAGERPEEAS